MKERVDPEIVRLIERIEKGEELSISAAPSGKKANSGDKVKGSSAKVAETSSKERRKAARYQLPLCANSNMICPIIQFRYIQYSSRQAAVYFDLSRREKKRVRIAEPEDKRKLSELLSDDDDEEVEVQKEGGRTWVDAHHMRNIYRKYCNYNYYNETLVLCIALGKEAVPSSWC